jgi:hypothetical protein
LFLDNENEFSDFQRAANWLFDKNKKLYCHFLSILILKKSTFEQIKTSSKFCKINAGFVDSGMVICSNEQVENCKKIRRKKLVRRTHFKI